MLDKPSRDFINQKELIKIILLSEELQRLLAQNIDEIPGIEYKDLYLTAQTLIHIKWNLMSLIRIGE